MRQFLDLDAFPLDQPDSVRGRALLARCRRELGETGMFSLDGLIRPEALRCCVAEVEPLFETTAFTHSREHNIYFDDGIEDVEASHPALSRFRTVNHTVCGDQIPASLITRIYEWQPLIDFLAGAMDKRRLYRMADPLARINVMAYRAGEELNWHFDRAEFTTTCLLQAPVSGGQFQYRSGLRSDADPNYEGVGRVLTGDDDHGCRPCRWRPARSTSSRGGTLPTGLPRSAAIARASSPCSRTTRHRTSPSAMRSVSASTAGPGFEGRLIQFAAGLDGQPSGIPLVGSMDPCCGHRLPWRHRK